ncbi:galactose-1-phosphate uridylyltransferase [Actinocorallia sp. A-T 12471]|uniref:galactose-1-phosphate uridylyltransferase n=1 Tax=Actinocorallia sp. A-T 12471 TaxID=3089813 RepID=UPI0029D25FCD|nr:galactose-1-phosphate uridylyltransferase [Actinocorallia sp. A-T 12471]MDX6741135.1 galactose-1-phosphate uridylyltransferase [Actinocorallia sp. A-T 12471]
MRQVSRTEIRLADGRALWYYDRADADRSAPDPRELPARSSGSQGRFDPLLREWVTYAAHRQDRTFLPDRAACPLCPSMPGRAGEIPSGDYEVVVFENRFPSFSPGPGGPADGAGHAEVVCFTPDHDASFAALTRERVETVMEAWADRTAALSALPYVAQVFCFENRGAEIGVTLPHPHGQIYAYPFVTPRTERALASARAHRDRTGRDLYADVLAAERLGERVVAETAHWTAFVPAAARWPYEVHLYPHRSVPDIPALTDVERADFAALYLAVLGAFDALFDAPAPYIAAWHQAPTRTGRDLARLHLQVFTNRRAPGKLKYLAGSEAAMGAFVSDVLPEQAAHRLRAALGAVRPG